MLQNNHQNKKTAKPQCSLYGFMLIWTLPLNSTVVWQNWWPSAVQKWKKRSLTAKLTLSPDQVEVNVNLWNDFKITLKSLPPHRYEMKTVLYADRADGITLACIHTHTHTVAIYIGSVVIKLVLSCVHIHILVQQTPTY